MKLTLMPLQQDDVIRIRCEGDISLRDQPGPADPLDALLGPMCYTHTVLLNLERAQIIDTSGISWLMRNHKRFSQAQGALVLYQVSPSVIAILDFVRLTPLLRIASTEALARELAVGEADGPPAEKGPAVTPFDQSMRRPG